MLLSEHYLETLAEKRSIYGYATNKYQQILNENMALAEHYDSVVQKTVKIYDVFLSHSSLDKRLILTLIQLFNDAKYSVYVDLIEDTQLDRTNVNKTTAGILRSRMNTSRGLAYVATSNSTNSKWCPWELGYFDGKKDGRCCILPVMEGTIFPGQEYLGLYPYIEYERISGQDKYDFWVYNQGTNEYIILSALLALYASSKIRKKIY